MAARDRPIAEYGIIGNCETAALINADGGIDWLCLPAFDGPSFFGALLDCEKAGEFFVRPKGEYRVERSYLADTAILETRFITERGTVVLTDFFVVARKRNASFYNFTSLHETRKLVRLIRAEGGEVEMEICVVARPDYARRAAEWKISNSGFACEEASLFASIPLQLTTDALTANFTPASGETHFVVLDYSERRIAPSLADVQRWFGITKAYWDEWALFNYYRGPHREFVHRSAVTLKLLTYAPTGAFVAAPTTSLPERIGADKNWDYRFTWVRDTALFIGTLFRIGYSGEAKAFFSFVLSACEDHELPVLFPIRNETKIDEQTLDHLAGYRGSQPVRIGNRAADQVQLDGYGYLFQALFFWRHTGGKLNQKAHSLMEKMTRYLTKNWREPDHGIWELPGAKQHAFGKVMAWVGLQRARDLAGLSRKEADTICAAIEKEVLERGVRQSKTGSSYLAESFDGDERDASALLAFTLGFSSKGLARGTREEIERALSAGDLLYRNEPDESRGEGAFLLCSFWWIDHSSAKATCSAPNCFWLICSRAGPLGLFSEEIDPASGEFLGNFPQAFSHLGAIGSILNLHEAKQRRGWHALPEHEKFQRSVGRTVGWIAVIIGFFRVPRTFRLLVSRKSKWRER